MPHVVLVAASAVAIAAAAALARRHLRSRSRVADHPRVRDERALRRRAERLAAIVEAQQDVAATLDLEALLPRVIERARLVTGADAAALGRPEGDELVYAFATGLAAGLERIRVPAAASLGGLALRSGSAVRCDDALRDPRAAKELVRRTGIRGYLTIPLAFQGRAVGVLTVASFRAAAFGDDDLQALQLLGASVAAALAHADELAARQRALSERTEALAALREREEHYRAVTDGVPLYIADLDREARYRFVNRAYEVALGKRLPEIVGRTMAEVLGPRRFAVVERHVRAALAGERRTFDVPFPLSPGDVRQLSVQYVPRVRDDGEVTGFLALCADVTERCRLEDQLRQAQKMDAVGQLAGGVAHDFNNLLTVIGSVTDLLLGDGRLEADQRADLADVRRASERAADLTRKLLAFSRRQALQPRVVDLHAVVSDAEKMLRRLVREDVTLEVSGRPGVRVFADPAQLEQVLVNLVVNACDAMPGGGALSLETAEVDVLPEFALDTPGLAPGRHAVLVVADTGAGMDPAVLARAFEPFFTTKPLGKGTGLGLATVYGIVRQSGGAVRLASAPGQGTTVSVYLPAATCAAQEDAPAAAPAPAGGSETVLLVEDEPGVRLVARRVLEARGYRVVCAENGRHALEVASGERAIDVLVTDVVMPELGGRELALRLREARPGLAVLLASGYAADALDGGVVPGGVAFLQKPFTPDGLARAVRDALDAAA